MARDLRPVYTAPTEAAAKERRAEFCQRQRDRESANGPPDRSRPMRHSAMQSRELPGLEHAGELPRRAVVVSVTWPRGECGPSRRGCTRGHALAPMGGSA